VLGVVSETDGTFGWQLETPADTRVIPLAETGFVAASSATTGTYQVIDLDEGSTFSFDSVIAEDLRGLFASGSGAIAAVPIGDGTTATVIDLDAKSATFAVPLAPDGVPQSILAASSQSLYLAGGAAGALQAVDRATGETRWTLENPAPPSFGFAEWGGNLVLVRAPGGDPSIALVQGVR
jgi:outer membrane protein assembly factor BamB